MNLTEKRQQNADDILQGRFIRRVAADIGKEIDKAQRSKMSERGFDSNDWYSERGFTATETGLEYTHLKKHRFVDMKTRTSKTGKHKKKNHPIHNRIVWGFYNQMIKELHFGFTDAVKAQLRELEG